MLEDLYAENLVDSPDDIERVIEGGGEERRENSEKESGDEEQKNEDEKEKDKEKAKIKRKFGPRPVLNPQRLKGPRGIGIMESFFSDIKMKGKGHEREDLDLVLGRLEHWGHRLMPRMQFDDCLKKIEQLGSKKEISNFVKRIRLGLEEDVVEREEVVEDVPPSPPPPEDAFDQLMSGSTVPHRPQNMDITAEQREQMLRNRLLAEERRAARLKRADELKAKFLAEHSISQSVNSQTIQLGDTANTNNEVIIENDAILDIQNNSTNNNEKNSHRSSFNNDEPENDCNVISSSQDNVEDNERRIHFENDQNNVIASTHLDNGETGMLNENTDNENDRMILESNETGQKLEYNQSVASRALENNETTVVNNETGEIS